MSPSFRLSFWLLALSLCGCTTSQRIVGQPTLDVHEETIRLVTHDKVDLLFMVDNSPSMAPKQARLVAQFPALVDRIRQLASKGQPASFHIGVVTSDLGAGPYTLNNGQCHPDGDGGRLHGCANTPLTDGASFIDYDTATGTSNLGSAELAATLSCLADVGETGCGFEAPLESIYRTLTTPSLAPGFLRDDALLVIVLLTDEDDCSAPPDSDLFDPSAAGIGKYGVLHSFRCTQAGVVCNGAPLSGSPGPLDHCEPAAGGPLFDLSRYRQLLSTERASGGLKDDPADVLLVSLAAPPAPFAVLATAPCADQPSSPSCALLDHSCVGADSRVGDPAVRIHAVVTGNADGMGIEGSICDSDYATTIDHMASAMGARLQPSGCLPGAVVDLFDTGCGITLDTKEITRCGDGHLPCWDLAADNTCPARATPAGSTQQLRLVIEGMPLGSTAIASCPLYVPSP